MALNQEVMASNQETTEPNRQPRDRKAAETEAARLKAVSYTHLTLPTILLV